MNGLAQYRSQQVETAGPEDGVVLLYDGARRFVDRALAALQAGDHEGVSTNTAKAQAIFAELASTLDLDAGPVCQNLLQLYDYWTWRLSQGIFQKDPNAFAEVSATLVEMHAAWAEAARRVRAQRGARSFG